MNMETELGVYLRARFTLLLLQTAEEERALQLLKSVAATSGRPVLAWDIAEGFQAVAALTRKSIVVTFPGGALPAELKNAAVRLELLPVPGMPISAMPLDAGNP